MEQALIADSEQVSPIQSLPFAYLRESRLLQLLPFAVYVCDAEGLIVTYNPSAVQLWGSTPQKEAQEQRYCGPCHLYTLEGSYLPPSESPIAACLTDGFPQKDLEFLLERANHSRIIIKTTTLPIKDDQGGVVGTLTCLEDITQQKQLFQALEVSEARYQQLITSLEQKVEEKTLDLKRQHEQLQKSEERYHKMIEEVEDYAIILLDKQGVIRNWNKGAEKIKGYSEAEIVGKSFKVFYLPEDQKKGLPEQLIQRAIHQGKALHEGWRVRKDGSTFWGSIVITALHNEEGAVIGFTKVTRDLTERKLSEDKMQRYAQELEFQNKELEQFAYAASHDMKEPLRKIQTYNSFILEEAAQRLTEKERAYLARSLYAAQRMRQLIDDLLEYSQTTLPEERLEPVDLNEVLEDALTAQKETLEEKQVLLQKDALPVVEAIGFQMRQLFDNLLGNALKYSHSQRRLQLQIRCEKVRGSELAQKEADSQREYYKIAFMDNGVGFEQEQAERIFDLFQRLGTKTHTSGTGIGLTICRRIVQNHEGFIQAIGKRNEGACFVVYLPVKESF